MRLLWANCKAGRRAGGPRAAGEEFKPFRRNITDGAALALPTLRSDRNFSVHDQHDKKDVSYLERVNADLTESLRRCHAIVDDYRAHLIAANSNEPQTNEPQGMGEETA